MRRVEKYRIHMATHWQFHPRQVDTLTVEEFDHFARQSDQIERERAEQNRKASASSRGR